MGGVGWPFDWIPPGKLGRKVFSIAKSISSNFLHQQVVFDGYLTATTLADSSTVG